MTGPAVSPQLHLFYLGVLFGQEHQMDAGASSLCPSQNPPLIYHVSVYRQPISLPIADNPQFVQQALACNQHTWKAN